jgi:hypothetical protein
MNEKNFEKLYAQRTFWRGNNRNTLCWAFYCLNDNKEVNATTLQTIWCILCHNNPILNVNPKIQTRKGLIIYNSSYGIAALRKHVNSYRLNILQIFEEKNNCPLREMKDNLPKKNQIFILIPYLVFFATKEPFKKDV